MSWLRTRWTHYRQRRAQRYLAAYPEYALDALRQAPGLAHAASQAFWMEATAEAHRQTAQWPILNQLGLGAKHPLTKNLPKVTPFNLRHFSEYPPARRAINAVCNPIVDLDWSIEPIRPLNADVRQQTAPTADQQRRIALLTGCLQRPNDITEKSWRVLCESILEDIVVGGYGAVEVVQTKDHTRPWQFFGVDGHSIRINASWQGDPNEIRYTQSLAYVGLSVGTHEIAQLRDDELLYLRLNPRTSSPFGLGYLEVAFRMVNAWLGAVEYAERRASNATPNFGIFLGENIDMQTARRWQQYWRQEIEGNGQVPIIAGGRQPTAFKLTGTGQDQLYLRWQELLVRFIAMAFGVSPLKLGMERDVNRNTANTQMIMDWDTIAPVANTVSDALTAHLLWGILGWKDLAFRWVRQETDQKREAEIRKIRYDGNALTIDEWRELDHLPPLPGSRGAYTRAEFEARAKALEGAGNPEGARVSDGTDTELAALLRQADEILHQAGERPTARTNGRHKVLSRT